MMHADPPKAGRYFTGHCLALDEHPLARKDGEFRERVIELFAGAQDSISFLKDGILLHHGMRLKQF